VAFGFCVGGDFGAGGEDAEGWVDSDLFYDLVCGLRFGRGFGGGLGFGQVEAGDLEAIEEEAGAARVDVVGGDALEDFSDGGLDCGPVFWQRQVEGRAAAAALFWVGDGLSRGVVVVAELFLAEAGAGAAASVGEDVAALVLFRCFGGVLHSPSPRGTFFVQSLRKTRDRSGLSGLAGLLLAQLLAVSCLVRAGCPGLPVFGLKAKARLLAGPVSFFLSTFNSTELSETKFQFWRIYFLACRWLILGCFLGFLRGF
jgi:hypothetical protein